MRLRNTLRFKTDIKATGNKCWEGIKL